MSGDLSTGPTPRDEEECRLELAGLDQAHLQNETGRDAFLALAHTALFAASIAFVGELADTKLKALLVLGWLSSLIGLLALTVSFHVATKHIERRRHQLWQEKADDSQLLSRLNFIALWSFPAALIAIFLFATVNIVEA